MFVTPCERKPTHLSTDPPVGREKHLLIHSRSVSNDDDDHVLLAIRDIMSVSYAKTN